MIIFVGNTLSKKGIPFVGTKSYKTLLGWIYEMDLDISDILLTNASQAKWQSEHREVQTHSMYTEYDVVVALGSKASEILTKKNVPHFILPNPQNSNKKVSKKLDDCSEYIDLMINARLNNAG